MKWDDNFIYKEDIGFKVWCYDLEVFVLKDVLQNNQKENYVKISQTHFPTISLFVVYDTKQYGVLALQGLRV